MSVPTKVPLFVFAVVMAAGVSGCEHAKVAQDNRTSGNLTGYGSGHGYGDGSSTGADYASLDKAADHTSEQRNHDSALDEGGTTLRSTRSSSGSLPKN